MIYSGSGGQNTAFWCEPLRDDFDLLLPTILADNTNLRGLIHELAEVYRLKKRQENAQLPQ